MAICKFFQNGNCKKGNNCNFEHVKPNTDGMKYNEASVTKDLGPERPLWKLSVYGPAKEEPNFIVQTDVSPEEDRLMFYKAQRLGNLMTYESKHKEYQQLMEDQVKAVISNTREALMHYENEKRQGPNQQIFSPFVGAPNIDPTRSTFGNPSRPSVFGTLSNSTFGATSTMIPSAFQNTAQPPFGASSFGQPSTLNSPFKQQPGSSTPALNTVPALPSSNDSLIPTGTAFSVTEANISDDDKQAFCAERFELWRIPEVEPVGFS